MRSPMVLSTHGSGRARGEREEQKAWAVAQSLQRAPMMMTFILPEGAKAEKIRIKIEKLREATSYEKQRQRP